MSRRDLVGLCAKAAVFSLAFVVALFSTEAIADAAQTDVVDLYQSASTQSVSETGPVNITFLGMNPLRTKITAGSRNTTVTNAPQPAFLQSTGSGTSPAATAATTNQADATKRGLGVAVTGYECKTDDGTSKGKAISPSDALAAWYVYLTNAQNSTDKLIAAIEPPTVTYKTDDAKIAAFQGLGTTIATDPSFLAAKSCLNNLAAINDFTNTSSADKTTIQTLTSGGSPYSFMLGPGSPIPVSQYLLALDPFTCSNLLGGSSSSTQSITWGPLTTTSNASNATISITQKCLGQVALSAGFSFNTATQQTFSAVSTPNGTMTPTAATVQPATSSNIQTVPTAYVHWSPSPACQGSENCWWITFGLGVTSLGGSTSNNVNYMLGISRSFSRYAYLTAGLSTVQQTVLAGGYKVGTQVAPSTTIPTATSGTTAFFFGVSFGGTP